jgi:hypothetical protein
MLSIMGGGELGQVDRWLAPLREAAPDPDAWAKAWEGAGAEQEEHETIVADLRSSSGRYRGDRRLARLIADLREASPRFRSLWEARRVDVYDQERKTIEHPALGLLHLDCDILTTHRNDLRVVVFAAAANSPSAKALEELSASCPGRGPLTDSTDDRRRESR